MVVLRSDVTCLFDRIAAQSPWSQEISEQCRENRGRCLIAMDSSFCVLFSGGSDFVVFVPRNEKKVVVVLVSLTPGRSPLFVRRRE